MEMSLDKIVLLCSKERDKPAVEFFTQTVSAAPKWLCHTTSEVPQGMDLVIDWGSRFVFRKEYSNLSKFHTIYFLFDNLLVDISDECGITRIEKQAIEDKKWKICKTINEARIEISMIHRDCYLKCYPMEIQLESTDMCNAECIMCSHFYRNGTHSLYQHSAVFEAVRKMLPYLKTVYLHGNGEPFLIPDLLSYLSLFREYDIKFAANSNLSIVNDDIISALREDFSELNVSCDAADKRTYEYIRQGLSFENFTNNCITVRRACPDLRMRIACITMRQNIVTLPDIVRFASRIGFDEIVFTELSTDIKLENEADTMTNYPQIADKYFKLAHEVGRKCGISVKTPEIKVEHDDESLKKEWKRFYGIPLYKEKEQLVLLREKLRTNTELCRKDFAQYDFDTLPKIIRISFSGICDWCVQRPYIDLDGNVSICCINQYVCVGNLFEQSFEEIWNGKKLQQIRKMFYEGFLPHFCFGCEFLAHGMLSCINIEDRDPIFYKKMHINP